MVKLLLLVRVTYHQHFYVIAGYISTFVSRLEIRTAKMDGFRKKCDTKKTNSCEM